MFDQLSSLDTSRTNWKIKVRVTRIWASIASQSGGKDALKGYNLILLDDDNCHVQAFVYPDNWKGKVAEIVEGCVYIISNFYTKDASGSLRPTSSKIIINFSNSTYVEKVPEDDFMIPMHKFEFIDLSELFGIVSNYENPESPEYSTDVIGVVEDFERVKVIQTMFGERNIFKFRITDGRYSHKVSVWGNLSISTDQLYDNIKEKPIIAIVTSCKLKIFKSSVQISTLPSSKIYLNLDTDSVHAMRVRLEEEGYQIPESVEPSQLPAPVAQVIETITLKELGEKTNSEELKKLYHCIVKIITVEQNDNWWYDSCTFCDGSVYKLEGRYKCSECHKSMHVPEKKYKIVVLAEDSTDAFNFILKDKAAKRVVGRTATNLIAETKKMGLTSGYPAPLCGITGKEFIFTIQISSDNVLLDSKPFYVIDASDIRNPNSSPSEPSPSQQTMAGFTSSSFSGNIIDLAISGNTPDTAKSSTSKKMKTEK